MSRRADYAAVFDVDGTLTHQSTGSLANVVDRQALAEEGRQELHMLRERYLPLAKTGQLSHAKEMEWLRETFRIYAACGLTRSGWMAAIDTVSLREGVVDTLKWLLREGIPTAAISYGCADFVEHLLERHGVRLDAIYAGRLRYQANLMVGADLSTFVIPAHKGERSRHFADVHDVPHTRIIAVGDSGGDRHLGHLLENRVLISDTEEHAEDMRKLGLAAEIHVSASFHSVRDFIQRRISGL